MAFQVSNLTHNKKSYEKEFLDFKFNGKYISEFQLVAVSDGDRYSFHHSPEFEDETSPVVGADGQHFWGTKIKTQIRTFKLETDGMTEHDLDNFKTHFRPGQYGQFIEDHLATRFGYCRVSQVSNFQLLPFQTSVSVLGKTINVNMYKGSVDLTFEFDDPYLYSTINYINTNGQLIDSDFIETSDSEVEYRKFEDDTAMLKAIYTNKIPTEKSWNIVGPSNECYIGGGYKIQSIINDGQISAKLINNDLSGDSFLQTFNGSILYYNPSNINTSMELVLNIPHIFTNVKWDSLQQVFIANKWDGRSRLYYASILDDINSTEIYKNYESEFESINEHFSFPTTSTIQISKPILREDVLKYQPSILPKMLPFTLQNDSNLQIIYDPANKFEFTTPNFFYSINLAIKLAWDLYDKNEGQSIINNATEEDFRYTTLLELEEEMVKNIKNKRVLSWIINILTWFKRYRPMDNTDGIEPVTVVDKSENKGMCNDEGQLNGKMTVDYLPQLLGENYILKNGIGEIKSVEFKQELHWAALFNLFMLYFISLNETPEGTKIERISQYLKLAPKNFLSLCLHIDGKTNDTYINYNCQKIEKILSSEGSGDGIIAQELEIIESQNAGDSVQSSYLKLCGGNTFDINSGLINDIYCISFYRVNGFNNFRKNDVQESLFLDQVQLNYNYTYI